MWSRATGENLLFISFTNAQPLQGLNSFAHDKLGMNPEEIQHLVQVMEEDDGMDDMELYDLARRFGVNKRQLPVIVVTNDIKSNEAIVIKTSSKDVGDQLLRLTSLADREDYSGSLDYINPRDFGPHSQRSFFRKGIAEILSEVFTFLQLKKDPYDREARRLNEKAVQRSIRRLEDDQERQGIHDHRQEEPSTLFDEETVTSSEEESLVNRDGELLDYGLCRRAQCVLTDSNVTNPYLIPEEKMQGAEEETFTTLFTYNLISWILVDYEVHQYDVAHRLRKFDFSTLSSCLGNMFENELSNSIVQKMRQCMGIPMPEFFGEYYPGMGSFIVLTGNNHQVNLNQCNRNQDLWIAPTIGDARAAYECLRRQPTSISLPNINYKRQELWRNLNLGRNAASHRLPVDREGFQNTFTNFSKFLDGGFFSQLVRIKRQLRGG